VLELKKWPLRTVFGVDAVFALLELRFRVGAHRLVNEFHNVQDHDGSSRRSAAVSAHGRLRGRCAAHSTKPYERHGFPGGDAVGRGEGVEAAGRVR
jgi:hypothetical protein